MFGRKIKCRCGKKINQKYVFCPYCGIQVKEQIKQKEEFNKFLKELENDLGMPFFMKKPFERIMSEFEKQLRELEPLMEEQMEQMEKMERQNKIQNPLENSNNSNKNIQPKNLRAEATGINIDIRTTNDGQPVIQIRKFGDLNKEKEKFEGIKNKILTEEEKEKYSKFPRKEPIAKIRRFSDKIVYEISLPGVKNKEDVIINKLQNSIEIKALSKDKVYFKLIPLALPIKNYSVNKEKLILELKS